MEQKEILQTLEEMKRTLTEINSAKEQVDSTIKAYSALQSSIRGYAGELQPIAEMMNSIVSTLVEKQKALTEQADAIIKSFTESLLKECETIHSSFETRVKNVITNLSTVQQEEINKLANQNNKLEAAVLNIGNAGENIKSAKVKIEEVATSVSKLKDELAASQKTQDDILAKISTDLTDNKNTNNLKFAEITSTLSTNYNNLLAVINEIFDLSKSSVQKLTDLHSKVDDANEKIKSINGISSSIKTKVESYEAPILSIAKMVSFVRILTIISVILSLFAIVVSFLK